jgi:hypothetical protein
MQRARTVLVLFALALPAAAGGWADEAKVTASDPSAAAHFGVSVSLEGDVAVMGADQDQQFAGAAYVFRRVGTSWIEEAKLVASDAEVGDRFGAALAVSGNRIVVGAPGEDTLAQEAGAVYVFDRGPAGWSETAVVRAGDGFADQYFGAAVAVDGDRLAAGGPIRFPDAGAPPGAAYVFERTGPAWTQAAKVEASPAVNGDLFGWAVALGGDTLAVGVPEFDGTAVQSGAVFVFVRAGGLWTQQAKLKGSGASAGDLLGSSVAISGDTIVAGAPEYASQGAGYVFQRNGTDWSEQARLEEPANGAGAQLGRSAAIDGDAIVLGSNYTGFFSSSGAAHVFRRSGAAWGAGALLLPSDGEALDLFSTGVALSGEVALVGSPFEDEAGPSAGAAYFYRDSGVATYCVAGTSASGCRAALSAAGRASASAPSGFVVSAASLEGQRDALLFFGTRGRHAHPWGNGTSFLCLLPPFTRLVYVPGTGASGVCDGGFSLEVNALWCPSCPQSLHNPGAGALAQMQLWYRDPGSTSNRPTSLSDALEFCVDP